MMRSTSVVRMAATAAKICARERPSESADDSRKTDVIISQPSENSLSEMEPLMSVSQKAKSCSFCPSVTSSSSSSKRRLNSSIESASEPSVLSAMKMSTGVIGLPSLTSDGFSTTSGWPSSSLSSSLDASVCASACSFSSSSISIFSTATRSLSCSPFWKAAHSAPLNFSAASSSSRATAIVTTATTITAMPYGRNLLGSSTAASTNQQPMMPTYAQKTVSLTASTAE